MYLANGNPVHASTHAGTVMPSTTSVVVLVYFMQYARAMLVLVGLHQVPICITTGSRTLSHETCNPGRLGRPGWPLLGAIRILLLLLPYLTATLPDYP